MLSVIEWINIRHHEWNSSSISQLKLYHPTIMRHVILLVGQFLRIFIFVLCSIVGAAVHNCLAVNIYSCAVHVNVLAQFAACVLKVSALRRPTVSSLIPL
jgi:hypothetical protein